MKIKEFEMWCQEMDSRLKEANEKGVPLIIEDLNRKGIDLSKDISYIQSNKNKTVMEDNKVIVDTVIDLLIDIDCDGETMQFILQKVGLEWQMLRQLMLTMPIEKVEYLLEERKDLGI